MRITDLLTEDGILLSASVQTKEEVINMLVSGPKRFGCITDAAACRADVLAREHQGTTALPHGIAIPHAKSRGVSAQGISVMTVPGGIDFGAADGTKTRLIFLLVGPENDPAGYQELLSALLLLLIKNVGLAEQLIDAKSSVDFMNLLRAAEQ
ncbi:MAG: PTS sugar transporter subunit IIA [Pseudoflavonifractor sp.]